jgi:geranylgeranylglycerol-phosphate geranylgeranyltransferase
MDVIRFNIKIIKNLKDILALTKISRVLAMACLAFIAGTGFAGPLSLTPKLVLGLLSIALGYAAFGVLNDIVDVRGDRITEADRPIARGSLKIGSALLLFAVFLVSGLLVGSVISPAFLIFMAIELVLGVFYNLLAKGYGLLSYAVLALAHNTAPFLTGFALVAPLNPEAFVAAGYLFLTIMPAIAIKDFKDVAGDSLLGKRTLPIAMGERRALKFTSVAFLLAPATFLLPYLTFSRSVSFLVCYAISSIWKISSHLVLRSNPTPGSIKSILKGFRYSMGLESAAWIS